MKLYCSLVLGSGLIAQDGWETEKAVLVGMVGVSPVRYHSIRTRILTWSRYPAWEQYQVGSLTGRGRLLNGNGRRAKVPSGWLEISLRV